MVITVVTSSDSSNSLASLEISSLVKISFEPSRNILSPFSLDSPPNRVFRNFADHGGTGILAMPSGRFLTQQDLLNALKEMHNKQMYKELVFYVEACESGSMFTDFPDNLNIYVTTAANADGQGDAGVTLGMARTWWTSTGDGWGTSLSTAIDFNMTNGSGGTTIAADATDDIAPGFWTLTMNLGFGF